MAPTQFSDDDVSSDLGGGRYLKQVDFDNGAGVQFTIARVEKINFEAKNGQPAYDKWVVTFEGDRCLPLNKTNLGLLAKWFGKHHSAWVGQKVSVYRDESISFSGRLVGGLRVRKPQPHDLPALALSTELSSDPIAF